MLSLSLSLSVSVSFSLSSSRSLSHFFFFLSCTTFLPVQFSEKLVKVMRQKWMREKRDRASERVCSRFCFLYFLPLFHTELVNVCVCARAAHFFCSINEQRAATGLSSGHTTLQQAQMSLPLSLRSQMTRYYRSQAVLAKNENCPPPLFSATKNESCA